MRFQRVPPWPGAGSTPAKEAWPPIIWKADATSFFRSARRNTACARPTVNSTRAASGEIASLPPSQDVRVEAKSRRKAWQRRHSTCNQSYAVNRAKIRGIPAHADSISPNRHPEIDSVPDLLDEIARLPRPGRQARRFQSRDWRLWLARNDVQGNSRLRYRERTRFHYRRIPAMAARVQHLCRSWIMSGSPSKKRFRW